MSGSPAGVFLALSGEEWEILEQVARWPLLLSRAAGDVSRGELDRRLVQVDSALRDLPERDDVVWVAGLVQGGRFQQAGLVLRGVGEHAPGDSAGA